MKDRKKLKRLIRIRERVEHIREGALQTAQQALANTVRQQAGAQKLAQQVVHEFGHHPSVSAAELSGQRALLDMARSDIEFLETRAEKERAVCTERQEALALARRDVQVLETLDKRLKAEADRAQTRREQAMSDEIAARRFTRRHR